MIVVSGGRRKRLVASKLTKDEAQALKNWAEQYYGENKGANECPVCGSGKWNILDRVLSIPDFPIRESTPVVGFSCRTCGYFRFHSAAVAGIRR